MKNYSHYTKSTCKMFRGCASGLHCPHILSVNRLTRHRRHEFKGRTRINWNPERKVGQCTAKQFLWRASELDSSQPSRTKQPADFRRRWFSLLEYHHNYSSRNLSRMPKWARPVIRISHLLEICEHWITLHISLSMLDSVFLLCQKDESLKTFYQNRWQNSITVNTLLVS